MDGPSHYREAERLLNEASAYMRVLDSEITTHHVQLGQLAQVHALLAIAAATAVGSAGDDDWAAAVGNPPEARLAGTEHTAGDRVTAQTKEGETA